jgi:hypothetical protein
VSPINARHPKHVPGHKNDVQDCQWIQYLHTCGLLLGSCRPEADLPYPLVSFNVMASCL